MRTRNVISAVGVALLSVALLGACGDGDDSGDDSDGSSSSASGGGKASDDPNVGSGAKLAVTALDTAEGDVKNGAAFDLERDDDGGGLLWDVKVASGTKEQYELRISADGKKVESNNKDNELDDDVAKLADAELTAQEAAERAAKDHPGDVTALEIDTLPDGTVDWQVTLNDNGSVTEYKLDAKTGKTLSSEADD